MFHPGPNRKGAACAVAILVSLLVAPSTASAQDDGQSEPPVETQAPVETVVDDAPDCHNSDQATGDTIECATSSKAKIVITEIMQNPSMVWDSLGEWFEIYNAGSKAVDLANWTITDELNNTHVVAGNLLIQPGAYLTIARNPNQASNGGVVADYSTGTDVFLFNSSDRLVLLDENGREIDRVAWDDGATFPDPNGASMSLK